MDIKYNVYYATSPKGPWTLANSSPISHDDTGNYHVIAGLSGGVYYVAVVGGIMSGGEFLPLVSQPIGPQKISSWGMGIDRAKSIKVLVP